MGRHKDRNPKRKRAYEIWLASGGRLRNKDIAQQVGGVTADDIKRWKFRDQWEKQDPDAKARNYEWTEPDASKLDDEDITDEEAQRQAESMHRHFQDGMTDKQRLFCIYYVNSFNAVTSYQRAYRCKRLTACNTAYELLHKPIVSKYIRYLKELRLQSLFADGGDVVEMYMRIAFANINQFVVVKDGEVHSADSDSIDGQLVQEIKSTSDGVSIKLADRMKALQWLSDYFQLNPRDRHKKAYDDKVLAMKQKELEMKDFYG
jgi:phage terminase small subunit